MPVADARRPRRAWLLANRPHGTPASIAASGADAVVIDMTDPGRAAAERSQWAVEVLEACRQAEVEVFWQVRRRADLAVLAAIEHPGWSGVVVAGPDSPSLIDELDGHLARLEARHDAIRGHYELVACLDNARTNLEAPRLLERFPRISTVSLGLVGAVMDLRPERSGELHLLGYLNQRLIVLAGAYGRAPIDGPLAVIARRSDPAPAEVRQAARRGRALGFRGAMCLRQEQIKEVVAAYRPSRREKEWATAVLNGEAGVTPDGSWLGADELATQARAIVAEAGRAGRSVGVGGPGGPR
jgi:citrate lyase beta subunit